MAINWMTPGDGKVDYSWISELPDSYMKGDAWRDSKDLQKVFKNGLPRDANGNIDWDKSVEMIGTKSPELAYKFMASNGMYGSGASEKYEGQPQTVWVPDGKGGGKYVLRRYGNRGSVWDDTTAEPTANEESRVLSDGSVIQYGKRNPLNPIGTPDYRTNPELQPDDEPISQQQEYPRGFNTNEYDPQVEPQLPGEGYFPPVSPNYLGFPQDDVGAAVDAADAEGQQVAQSPGAPDTIYRGNPTEVEAAKKQGDIVGIARSSEPAFRNTVRSLVQALDQVAAHPRLESRLGRFDSLLPPTDTGAGEVQSYIDKAIGQQFTVAYEGLKGAGAITEGEGAAARAAISRLESRNMTPEAYKKALAEARYEIFELYRVVRAKGQLPDMQNPYPNPHEETPTRAPEKGFYSIEEYFGG